MAGQGFAVGFAALVLGRTDPLTPAAAILGASVLTNVLALRYLPAAQPVSRPVAGALLSLDTLLLTAVLYYCGGNSNPFSCLYIFNIALAAALLGPAWTVVVTGLSVACFSFLFAWHVPIPFLDPTATATATATATGADGPGLAALSSLRYFQAVWIAFNVAAVLTATIVVRFARSIETKNALIEKMRDRAASSDRLAAVTTLAAGAAHELGSPLATIAVAASELTRKLTRLSHPGLEPLVEDARLIRSEVERCRAVLDRMSAKGGEITGEGILPVPLGVLLEDVRQGLSPPEAARLVVEAPVDGRSVLVPRRALAQSLRDIVRNGLEASAAEAIVTVRTAEAEGWLRLFVEDRGRGMPPEQVARIGEPFVSTKKPGQGLGLGLFLARSLCDRLQWRMEVSSRVGVGTTVTIDLPMTGEIS